MFDWGEKLPTLQGDGLVLRMLDDPDVPALYEIFGDPEVTRYWSWSPFESLGDAQRLLDEIRGSFKARRLFQWGIAEPVTRKWSVLAHCSNSTPRIVVAKSALLSREMRGGEVSGREPWARSFDSLSTRSASIASKQTPIREMSVAFVCSKA